MEKYFRVVYRSPYHWDIYDGNKRLCKIRGELGDIVVYKDYDKCAILSKDGFETVGEAMQYICKILMKEPK